MSPEVWADAQPRIATAAAGLGITVAWPNETFTPPQTPAIWLDVEGSANTADPIELTGGVWQEDGSIWLHVMVPVGTGIVSGLTARKALSNAFRSVSDAAVGLVYRDGMSFDPLAAADDDGVYRRLTVAISYIFQDHPS